VKTAELLQIPYSFIATRAKNGAARPAPKEVEWHGYTAIDDSYNISLTTARAGIAAAAALAKRRAKNYWCHAGVPAWPSRKKRQQKTGAAIAASADHVAILRSMFVGISEGVRSGAGAGGAAENTPSSKTSIHFWRARMKNFLPRMVFWFNQS